jgi:hypothetical protein
MLGQMQASKSALGDLDRLDKCLAQFDDLTVSQFCGNVERWASEKKPLGQKTTAALNESVVSEYTAKLVNSRADRAVFEDTLSRMTEDKAVRQLELSEIAKRFVGGKSKYATKPAALKDIRLRFEAHAAAERRVSAASDIF